MSISREDLISAIENMTVLELAELVKELEEKFGVSAAAPVAVAAAAAPGEGGGEAAEEKTEFDVILTDTATLILEIAGNTLGSEYDHLDIAGQFGAQGTLEVRLLDHFAPQPGDVFDVLDFESVSGEFATIILPTLGNGLYFDDTSLLTKGVISVVPEPATTGIIGVLIGFLGWRRPRAA